MGADRLRLYRRTMTCVWREQRMLDSCRFRSTFGLSRTIRSVAVGNQWSGPVESCILWFHWTGPLVFRRNGSDCRTESASGSGPYQTEHTVRRWRPSLSAVRQCLIVDRVKTEGQNVCHRENWHARHVNFVSYLLPFHSPAMSKLIDKRLFNRDAVDCWCLLAMRTRNGNSVSDESFVFICFICPWLRVSRPYV